LVFPTISYANGPNVNAKSIVKNENGSCGRVDVSKADITAFDYQYPSLVPLSSETHGSEDVVLWAEGPMSWMFFKTHEQSYVGHVMAFALCVGPYENDPSCLGSSSRLSKSKAGFKSSQSEKLTNSMVVTLISLYMLRV
jgi:hypothetical protein